MILELESTLWPGKVEVPIDSLTSRKGAGEPSTGSGAGRAIVSLLRLKVGVRGVPVVGRVGPFAPHGDPGFPFLFAGLVSLAGGAAYLMIKGALMR